MAEQNDKGSEPAAGAPQPEIEAAATAPEPAAAAADPSKDAASAAGQVIGKIIELNPKQQKERDETFEVFHNALENVDWGYKLKSGNDRDIGHKSAMIAERAFIAASVYDPEQANKIYEQHAGKPPKEDLLKRANDYRAAVTAQVPGVDSVKISDLTAGIASVGERRDLAKLHSSRDELEKKMGNWNSVLGDAAERGRSHFKAGNDQLLKQEKPGENGMHILNAFRSGMRASGEYMAMSEHDRKHRMTLVTVKEQTKEYREVQNKIAAFGKKEGVEMQGTTGPNGQTVARFQKAFGVVKAALDKTPGKEGAEPATDVLAGVQTQKPGVAHVLAKAAQHSMGAGMGR